MKSVFFLFHIFLVVVHVHARGVNNNWALVLDSSKYWFNYRHMSNAISLYNEIHALGIPKEQIILMSGIGSPCESRNSCPGHVFNDRSSTLYPADTNIFSPDVQIDYAGEDVTVDNFMALLTGRHDKGTPSSRRILSNDKSNIFIFITGHGGDEFFKFQDFEEISAHSIGFALYEMKLKHRFNNLFIVADTCQASTLFNEVSSPGVIAISSSARNENSYAYYNNEAIGVSVIDRFSYSLISYLKHLDFSQTASVGPTIRDMYSHFNPRFLHSTPVLFESKKLARRSGAELYVRDFFQPTSIVMLLQHDSAGPKVGPQMRGIAAMTAFYETELEGVEDGVFKMGLTGPENVAATVIQNDTVNECFDLLPKSQMLSNAGWSWTFLLISKILFIFALLLHVVLLLNIPIIIYA